MRLLHLIAWDIRFQYKNGFYFLYVVMSLLYLCLLCVLPAQWKATAAALLIYSDPAAMGLFFMGAIILLAKSQRVIRSLAVSPVRVWEYILSKLLSLGMISVLVALLLAAASGGAGIIETVTVTLLYSFLFSLAGLVLAGRVSSLNQFFAAAIPAKLLLSGPLVFYFLGWREGGFSLSPPGAALSVLSGSPSNPAPGIATAILLCALLFCAALRTVRRLFVQAEEVTQ